MRRQGKTSSAVAHAVLGSGQELPRRSRGGRLASARFLVALVSVFALVLAIAPAAQAGKGVVGFFGNPNFGGGTIGGQFSTNLFSGSMDVNLTGAGVADPGDIYVVDANHRIQQFDSAGNFIRTWGRDVITTGRPNNISTTAVEICDTEHPTTPNVATDCRQGSSSGTGVGGEISNPETVAVNQVTGDVYLSERGRNRIQQFTASGVFIRAWGKDVIVNEGGPPNDNGTGFEVCDTTTEPPNTPAQCKSGLSGPEAGAFNSEASGRFGIAIAPATAPNAGNVLAVDRGTFRVQEFTEDGEFVRTFGWDVIAPGEPGNEANDEVQEVTVAAAGGSFTLSFNGQTTGPIEFDAPATDPATPGIVDSVQEALEDLGNIGVGDVSVAGGPGDATGSAPYEVTFQGALGDTDVAPLVINDDSLAAALGQTLTCTGPSTNGSVEFGWLRGGTPIPGETSSTYEISAADAGKVVQCTARVIHNADSSSIQASVPARVAAPVPGSAPPGPPAQLPEPGFIFTAGDSVEVGSAAGVELTCETGSWSGGPSFSYQWYRNGVPLSGNGAGTDTYTMQAADITSPAVFQCQVTGTNAGGTTTAFSHVDNFGGLYRTDPNPDPIPTPFASLSELGTAETTAQGASFEVCTSAASCKIGSPIQGTGRAPDPWPPGQFTEFFLSRIAVDSAGAIYTVDQFGTGRVQKFTPQAGPPELLPEVFGVPGAPNTETFDDDQLVDVKIGGGDNVLVLREFPAGATPSCPYGAPSSNEYRVQEFASDGTLLDTHAECATFGSVTGIGINPSSGDLYMVSRSFNFTGVLFPQRAGVYILNDTADPSVTVDTPEPSTNSAAISGVISPNNPPGYPNPPGVLFQIEYKLSSASEWQAAGPPTDAGSGGSAPFAFTIFPLLPNTSYDVRVNVNKSFGGNVISPPQTFTTVATPPSIESFSAINVRADSADLIATINPNGSATSYHFEYGTTPNYGNVVPIPDDEIGSGQDGISVKQHIDGLEAVTQHFRLVATNDAGVTESVNQTFDFYPPQCPNTQVRQQTHANYLPDCRAYEIASAEFAGGTLIIPSRGAVPSVGHPTSPSRIAYVAFFGAIPDTGPTLGTGGDQYVATRTDSGWKTRVVSLPPTEAFIVGGPPYSGQPTEGLETDLSMERFMSWNIGKQRNWHVADPTRSFAPYIFDPVGNVIGRYPTNLADIPEGEKFVGQVRASQDLNHFIFNSDIPFVAGGLPGDIYDNNVTTGTTEIISRDPNGAPFSGTPIEFSIDGSHILMSATPHPMCDAFGGCPQIQRTAFYMRLGGQTYDVTRGELAEYQQMTRDGSMVYFMTTAQLTPDDTDTSDDLYLWRDDDTITRVSKGDSGNAGDTDSLCNATWTENCNVAPIATYDQVDAGQGASSRAHFFWREARNPAHGGGNGYSDNFVAGHSGDVYFLTPETLEAGRGVRSRHNLHVYRPSVDRVDFVASLDDKSVCYTEPGEGGCSESPVGRIQVTPDGRFASFITTSQLTAYDNEDIPVMYRYDTVTRDLICVSCPPNNDPMTDDTRGSQNGLFMTDDGRPFFYTDTAVVPRDTNEATDVYEYVAGRPQLITTGTAAGSRATGFDAVVGLVVFNKAGLIGVSPDGTDAYLATFDRLVPQDLNGGALKIYNARVNGGFPFDPPTPPCEAADECHGATTSPPIPITNGTRANLGPGSNVKADRCATFGKRARKASRRAKSLRRRTKSLSGKRAGKVRRSAGKAARVAKRSRQAAKQCRTRSRASANRGATR